MPSPKGTPDPRVKRPGLVNDARAGVPDGCRRCSRCKEIKPRDLEHFSKNVAGGKYWNSWCLTCVRALAKVKMAERRKTAPDAVREARSRHAKSPGGRAYKRARTLIDNNARRQRLLGLPYAWTAEDWIACLAAWDGCCAYCGAAGDMQQDHFIPLSAHDCPGTVPENMVPACGGCNRSKGGKDPAVWLADRPAILARVRLILHRICIISARNGELAKLRQNAN